MSRPPLPLHHANPYVHSLLNTGVPEVKYQILSCQGNDILVGRLKITTPTASGHAFILRRYDTGAVSLTTMFRAAFPTASDEDEKRETSWIKETFDLTGNNGGPKDPSVSRLAGTWVDPDLASQIARDYRIGEMITAVIEARPDPHATYRKSGAGGAKSPMTVNLAKPLSAASPPSSQQTTVISTPSKLPSTTSLKPPSRISALADSPRSNLPVAKRRKESSPVPNNSSSPPPESPRRRSARSRSPAPKPSAIPVPLTASRTPKKSSRLEDVVTPAGSDETAYEEDLDGASGAIATSELHDQDVAEQKQMIAEMKAQREAAKQPVIEEEVMDEDRDEDESENENEDEEGEHEEEGTLEAAKPALKRSREALDDSPLKFNFKEPDHEEKVAERAIATNRRITGFNLEPRQKSFAWGVAAFALGFSAVTFLPNFF